MFLFLDTYESDSFITWLTAPHNLEIQEKNHCMAHVPRTDNRDKERYT